MFHVLFHALFFICPNVAASWMSESSDSEQPLSSCIANSGDQISRPTAAVGTKPAGKIPLSNDTKNCRKRRREDSLRCAFLEEPGPLRLVAIIAEPGHRWCKELSRHPAARDFIEDRLDECGLDPLGHATWHCEVQNGSEKMVVGIVLMPLWHIVQPGQKSSEPSAQFLYDILEKDVSRRKESFLCYIEYPVLFSAALLYPIQISLPTSSEYLSTRSSRGWYKQRYQLNMRSLSLVLKMVKLQILQ